jgi:hypothetical protein
VADLHDGGHFLGAARVEYDVWLFGIGSCIGRPFRARVANEIGLVDGYVIFSQESAEFFDRFQDVCWSGVVYGSR